MPVIYTSAKITRINNTVAVNKKLGTERKYEVDAIVIPANSPDSSVVNEVFEAAGFDEVMEALDDAGMPEVGQAIAVNGFAAAKYIILTTLPKSVLEEDKLTACYINSIECAKKLGIKNMAVPVLMYNQTYDMFDRIAYATACASLGKALGRRFGKERIEYDSDMTVYLSKYEDPKKAAERREKLRQNRNKPRTSEDYSRDADTIRKELEKIQDVNQESEKSYEDELKEYLDSHPGKTAANFNKMKVQGYMVSKGDIELADILGCDKTTVYRIRNGTTKKPEKKRSAAIAVILGLSDADRHTFMRCLGHVYPSDAMDYELEDILVNKAYDDIYDINDRLWEINPDWLLLGKPEDGLTERTER